MIEERNTMSRKALKSDAKYAMKQAVVNPYIVSLIVWIISVIFFAVQYLLDLWGELGEFADFEQMKPFLISYAIYLIIYFLINTWIQFGFYSYCLKVTNRDSTMSYGDLFSAAGYLLKALALMIMIALLVLLWSLLFIVPGIIAAYRYSQAMFIMVENPDKGVMQCIRESKEMMRGHKWEFFVLELSFLLWQLLSTATCGLALIYVAPYMTVTMAGYYNRIKNKIKPKTAAYEVYE